MLEVALFFAGAAFGSFYYFTVISFLCVILLSRKTLGRKITESLNLIPNAVQL